MKNLDRMREKHDDAVTAIKCYLTGDHGEELKAFAKWAVTTDCHDYLPAGWNISTEVEFASLLHNIKHALYDDGDICYVSSGKDGKVWNAKMGFIDPREHTTEYIRDNILHYYERNAGCDIIEVLTCSLVKFIELCENYHTLTIQRAFVLDYILRGKKFACKHYKTYQVYRASWPEELHDDIEKKRALYKRKRLL